MSEQNQIENGKIQNLDAVRPVPAARPLSDFAVETLGDELVIFDAETLQYHTLNRMATQIWRKCNGVASASMIASELGLSIEDVENTAYDLGIAALLESPAATWPTKWNRRRATKIIVGGVAGAVGLPVVLSITAPSHQAAATGPLICTNDDYGTACPGVGSTCQGSSWGTLFCCSNGGTPLWQDPVAAGICANPEWGWTCGAGACPPVQPAAQFQVYDIDWDESVVDDSVPSLQDPTETPVDVPVEVPVDVPAEVPMEGDAPPIENVEPPVPAEIPAAPANDDSSSSDEDQS